MQPKQLKGFTYAPLQSQGGYDPDFVRQYYASLAPRMASQTAQPKQRGHGGFLSSIISELGGAGGAAGGAALGSLLLPGIGTVVGAGLGGLFGGTGGRLAENKIRDNRWGVGDALKEGALSGALSLVGEGYQAAKGAKAAANLSKLGLEGGQDVARQGILEGAGRSLKAGAGGYGIGATAKGEGQLTAQGSRAVEDTLRKLKIPASSPENMATQLGSRLSSLSATLDNQYTKGATALSKTEMNGLKNKIYDQIMSHPDIELSKAGQNQLKNKLSKLVNAGDTSKLWQFTKDLESKGINFGAAGDAKLVDREAINRIFRENIRDTLNNKVPGVANTNKLFHDAKSAERFVLKAAQDVKGGGLVSKVTNLSPVKSGEAKLGAALENVGKVSAGTGGPLSQVLHQAKIQAPAGLIRAASGASQMPQDTQQGIDPNHPDADLMQAYEQFSGGGQGMPQMGGMGQGMDQQMDNPYPQENLLRDIQRDPKHTSEYLSLYKTLASINQPQKLQSSHGKATSQQYALAQTGMQGVQQLQQLLQQDPGVLNRSATPGQSLPGVGGFIQNAAGTGEYQAVAGNVLDALARARTGAQMNKQEEAFYRRLLPRAGDSQATIQKKLAELEQAFSPFLEGDATPDLSNQLMQMQGAY